MLLFSFLACSIGDYGIAPTEKHVDTVLESELDIEMESSALSEGDEDNHADHNEVETPDGSAISMRIESVIQRMGWGNQVTRCQIEVAFDPPRGHEDPHEPPENYVAPPMESGECVYTSSDEPNGQPAPDDWHLEGEVKGPSEVYLHSETRSLTLYRHEMNGQNGQQGGHSSSNRLRYQWPGCNLQDFPFGEVFDLEVPASEDSDVPPFVAEAALVVGPDMEFIAPHSGYSNIQLDRYGGDDLYVSWAFLDEHPDIDHRIDVMMNNNMTNNWNSRETLHCLPDAVEETLLLGDVISQFSLNQYFGEDAFSTGLNVHSNHETEAFDTPWGQEVRGRSVVSIGGMMAFVDGQSSH